jgi:hypothetical protein
LIFVLAPISMAVEWILQVKLNCEFQRNRL